MTDNRYIFERLGNANHPEWALRMEAIFTKKALWGMIEVLVHKTKPDGTTKTDTEMETERIGLIAARDATKMAEARAELVLRVEAGQLAHMTSRDPMIIWQNLERVHRSAGFATSLALRRQFLMSKKLDTETMEAWIGRIQSMVLRMEYAGIVVTDQDKILAFTMGLPTAYEAVIINFDATPPENLTVEHVISRLLNEETRQNSTDTTSTPAAENEPNVAFAARRAADHTCYFCDKKGHFKSDCPERACWEESKRKKATETAAAVDYDSDDFDGVW